MQRVVDYFSDYENLIILFIFVMIISIINYFRLLWIKSKLKKIEHENKELKLAKDSFKVDRLKFQLQPHTLKNILATLNSLSARLNNGMSSLTGILEYIIYKGDEKDLVSVEEELDFIQQYITLNEQFTDEIDTMKVDCSKVNQSVKYFNAPSIPHMISAYFIENAFKHGDKSHPEFLKVVVALKDSEFLLQVTNRIRVKPSIKKKGIGLKNMHERLDTLFPDKYEINQRCNEEIYLSELKLIL